MSEHLSARENHEGRDELKTPTIEHEPAPQHQESIEQSPEQAVETARQKLEAVTEKIKAPEPAHTELQSRAAEKSPHPLLAHKELKDTTYSRTLLRTRKKLSRPARVVSKAIHSPILDRPSELAAQTVARPSGMLGGALAAMAGTIALFWVIKSHGYTYNYLAVGALFIAGTIVGLALEAAWKLLSRK